jgi:hypothetical protein
MCVHAQAGLTPSTDQMVGHMLDDNELLLRDNKTAKVILDERLYANDVYGPEMIALARRLCEANSDHPEFFMRYMPMVQQIKWGNLKLTYTQ